MDLEEFKYKTLNGVDAAENLVWNDPEMALRWSYKDEISD